MSENQGKTPYQGPKRCFGEFKCPKCNREWQSGYSWANTGQECKDCNVRIFPYKQSKLEKSDDDKRDPSRNHEQAKCEKCRSLGRRCY